MKHYKTERRKRDLITYFSIRLEKIQTDLSDDDTLAEYIDNHKGLKELRKTISLEDLTTLIVGNFLIQNQASIPYHYEVTEEFDTFIEI